MNYKELPKVYETFNENQNIFSNFISIINLYLSKYIYIIYGKLNMVLLFNS